MTWTDWNWINVFFVFVSMYIAINCFNDGRDGLGHLNMFACVLNGCIVASRLGL